MYKWALILVFLFPACKQKPHQVSRTAYIIGTPDIISVDKNNRQKIPDDSFNASVLIATSLSNKKIKFCSGTLIDAESSSKNMRIISNHHCFAITGEDGKATRNLLKEACNDTIVYFGFAPKAGMEPFAIKCKKGTLRTDFIGDLSVFTLEKNPGSIKPLSFLSESIKDVTNRKAMIIHYPDIKEEAALPPNGGNIKLPTAAVTIDNCVVNGEFPINEWHLDRTLPFSYRHTCDLIHGSSGSALIDLNSNKIIGINWGGIKIKYSNITRVDNVATQAGYAQAFIEGRVQEKLDEAKNIKNSSDAVAEEREKEAERKEAKSRASPLKACSTINSESQTSNLLTILFLLFPLIVLRGKRGY